MNLQHGMIAIHLDEADETSYKIMKKLSGCINNDSFVHIVNNIKTKDYDVHNENNNKLKI